MSINFVKLVELQSINQNSDKPYLHIKIYLDQELELFWEIDSFTQSSLQTVCEFDGVHKYRLSLRTKASAGTGHYISDVTKTYLNNSNRLSFSCSEEFKNQLELMKQCASSSQLLQLPFLSKNLPSIMEEEPENPVIDSPNSTGANEQSKEDFAATNSEYQSNNIHKTKNKIDHKESLESGNNTVIQKEFLQEEKAIESLLKTSSQKVKDKPGKWIAIASISLIVIVLFCFFIFNPKDKATIQPKERQTQESVTNTPNALTVEESVSFNLPKGYVALTFNEGPSTYTEEIMDILNQYKVGGTFFFIGRKVAKYSESVQSVASNGYAIGSMTMNNNELAPLPYEQQKKEVLDSIKLIEKITDEKIQLFRPPAALFNEDTQDILTENDLKLILWNTNPQEVKNRDSSQLLDTITKSELSGAIVFLEESQEVVNILPTIIETAQAQHLEIVSLN